MRLLVILVGSMSVVVRVVASDLLMSDRGNGG